MAWSFELHVQSLLGVYPLSGYLPASSPDPKFSPARGVGCPCELPVVLKGRDCRRRIDKPLGS